MSRRLAVMPLFLFEGSATDEGVPRIVVMTAVLVVAAASVAVCVRGLRAPLARPMSVLGVLVGFFSVGAAVFAALTDREPRVAGASAAFAAGLAHAVYFRLVPLPAERRVSRATLVRIGQWAGFLLALVIWLPDPPWVLVAVTWPLVGATVVLWAVVSMRRSDRGDPSSGGQSTAVRFPCPRCGTVVDWDEGVSSCTDCGLFVHLIWDPEEGEPAAFGPEGPPLDRVVRFACPSCGHAADWAQDVNACPTCGRRVRVHWNVHA